MEALPPPARTSLGRKLIEIGFAVIAILNVLLMSLEFLPPSQLEGLAAYEELLLFGPLGAALVATVWLAVRWQRRERRAGPTETGAHWHARLQGVLRYWLAFEIATYGFAKLLQTQFETANYQLDRPLGAVTGFTLTWFYFGYSRPFVIILGLIQIGGAALLLFRRTTLLGALVLLPVLVNIVFINLFYSISSGAFMNSVLFVLGLSFLIGLEWPRLRAAVFVLTHSLPAVQLGGTVPKTLLRVSVLLAAGGMIAYLKSTTAPPSPLDGVWRVDSLVKNGQPVALDSCGTAPDGWTRLYFARWQGCVARFHPYKYEPKRELRGRYSYNAARHQLRAGMWPGGKPPVAPASADSLIATVQLADRRHARLVGHLGKAPIELSLTRLRD